MRLPTKPRRTGVWLVLGAALLILASGIAVAIVQGRLRTFEVAVSLAAAGATLAAVVYAADAAHEARSLRREERLARLPELVEELAANLHQARTSTFVLSSLRWFEADSSRQRLLAALAVTGERFPRCEELASSPIFPANADEQANLSEQQIADARTAAMNEVIGYVHRTSTP